MTVALIQSIKDAEKKADEITRRARQEARRVIKSAETGAARAAMEKLARAETQAGELMKRAEKEAQLEAEPLRAAHQKEIDALKNRAGSRMPEALTMIRERIISWP